MRTENRTTGFADVCHRKMPPFRAGRCGSRRVAILYEPLPKASDAAAPHSLLPVTPSADTSLLVRITIIIAGLAIAAAGCAKAISLPPQVTLSEIEPSGRAA